MCLGGWFVCLVSFFFVLDPSSDSDGIEHLQARGDLGLQMNYAFGTQFSSFPTAPKASHHSTAHHTTPQKKQD